MSTITIRIDAAKYTDHDDCLAAAADAYVAEHPEAEGYDLSPRWEDNQREAILLTIPMFPGDRLTEDQAVQAIKEGYTVSVPYHVEGYGPGHWCHSWGAPELGCANGPEGYLRLGVSEDGTLIIDEHDDWCPEGMRGAPAGEGGDHIAPRVVEAD